EPQWPAFYSNLATIYATLGSWAEAERAARQALLLAPENRPPLLTLGQVLCELNRCDEAIGVYQRLLSLNANDSEALGGLGYAYGELGQTEQSIAAYSRASELSPDPVYRTLAATRLPLVYQSADDVLRWRQGLE